MVDLPRGDTEKRFLTGLVYCQGAGFQVGGREQASVYCYHNLFRFAGTGGLPECDLPSRKHIQKQDAPRYSRLYSMEEILEFRHISPL